MNDKDQQGLGSLAALVGSIDRRMNTALELLLTLDDSGKSKTDGDKIRMAVLSIQGGNNMLREVLGIGANASVPDTELISARRNLQRLIYDVGPQRVSDVRAAGLATCSDDAIALMSKLVESRDARWTTIGAEEAVVAIR